MYIFRKCDLDVQEVIMNRRQQDAQVKAAKHCSSEKKQQEAQAMAAKHQSEALQDAEARRQQDAQAKKKVK